MPGWEGVGGWWGGWVGRALCRNRKGGSEPCALCIQSQRAASAQGEGYGGSSVEVSGGLVAQVSTSACPTFSLSLLFLFSVLINASPARLTILPISRDTIKSYC